MSKQMALYRKSQLQISEGYRGTRRLMSVLCALGLGWSTAQYEVKSLSSGSAGFVDLSNASISLILACGIAYMLARCMIEYAMQPNEVRQWRLAQIDFILSMVLVRATLLMLAAGGLNRSVDTVLYVLIGATILLAGSLLLVFLGTIALMPLRMWIRNRQGRVSAASSVIEAEGWAVLITLASVTLLLIALGAASLKYEPLYSLWTTPPSPLAIGIFVSAAIAVVISVVFNSNWQKNLFLHRAPYTETKLPDGTIGITFHHDQPQSSKNGQSNDEPG